MAADSSCAPCDDAHITWTPKFASQDEAIAYAKDNLTFFPTGEQYSCPCGASSLQEDSVKLGECEQWAEHVSGHNRTVAPKDVQAKGVLDHKCRLVLQRKGLLGKGIKWFTTSLKKFSLPEEARGRASNTL